MRLLPPLAALVLLSCNGEKPSETNTDADTDSDTDSDSDTDTDGCSGDEACDFDQICEGGECIDGDRSVDFSTSVDILLNDPKDGRIVPADDQDFFAFSADEAQWLRISTITDDTDGGLDTVLSVYDDSGALHAWADEFATGNVSTYDSLLHCYLPHAGTWYIRVEDRSTWYNEDPQGSTSFTYELELKEFTGVTHEDDAYADPSVGVSMANGSTVYGVGVVLETEGDSDWIQIEMPWDDAPIEIVGMPPIDDSTDYPIPGSSAKPLVSLFTTDAEKVMQKSILGVDGSAAFLEANEDSFILQAGDADGWGAADAWFVAYIRTRDSGYGNPREEEDNDLQEQADVITTEEDVDDDGVTYSRGYIQGTLYEDADEDWFSFEDPYSGGSLVVACGGESYGALGDLALEVYDSSGNLVHTALDGDDSTPDIESLPSLPADTYGLRIYSEDGKYGLGSYYRCGFYAYDNG